MTAITHPQLVSVSDAPLYVAFEVGKRSWTLGMTSGFGVAPWVQTMVPGEWATLRRRAGEGADALRAGADGAGGELL